MKIKNYVKKILSTMLLILLFIGLVGEKSVYAYSLRIPRWSFKIYSVGNTSRVYSNDNNFLLTTSHAQLVNSIKKDYSVSTKEVAITTELIRNTSHTYITVDDVYVGKSNDFLLNFKSDRSTHYTTFYIKNLTPGMHKVEVRAVDTNAQQKMTLFI